MSNRCSECRFFTGNKCSARNAYVTSSSSACVSGFSAYGRDTFNDIRRCGDCRFFTGNKCSVKNSCVSANSSACASNKATAK